MLLETRLCVNLRLRRYKMQRTRLEDEGPSNIDITTVAGWLDALIRFDQRADDKCGCLADAFERPERYCHGELRRDGARWRALDVRALSTWISKPSQSKNQRKKSEM